jgi:DNA-binding transcriptional ArsR family regulator
MAAMIDRRPATRAEARALAHPLRLRILRLCLDEPLTNRELADRLDQQPATVLYHVRTLVRTGFLAPQAERRGRRGAREIPYLSTRKSWGLSIDGAADVNLAMIDALRAELVEAGSDGAVEIVRLAVRLRPEQLEALARRVKELVAEADAADDPAGDPIGLFVAVHHRR